MAQVDRRRIAGVCVVCTESMFSYPSIPCVCVCNVVVARKVAMETEDDSLGCWRVPIGNVRLVVCKTKKKTKTNLLLFALSY